MDPTEYFITPQKRVRNVTLTELTITQTNDKSTQTVQSTKHHRSTSVLQNPDVKHVSNNFSLQSQSASNRSGRLETTPKSKPDGGRASTSSGVGFSWEDETAKMALLLGSFQISLKYLFQSVCLYDNLFFHLLQFR